MADFERKMEYAWESAQQAIEYKDIDALKRSVFFLLKLRSLKKEKEELLPIIPF